MADGGGSVGPATAVQGFVNGVMEKVTAPIDALNLGLAKATFGILDYLPKFPAVRLYSDLVFQFGHSHPPPHVTWGIPVPSFGPVLASGCMSVLINGQPAARNGDMGLSVWCGGFFPIFEIFMGSSHVFMGGSRSARAFIDPSYHCLPSPFGGKAGKIGALDIAGAVFGVGMSALNVAVAMEKEDAAITASEEASAGQSAADAEAAAANAAAQGVEVATAAAQLAADIAAAAMGLMMGKDPGVGFPFGMAITGSPNVLVGGFPMPGWMTILKGLLKLLKPVIKRVQMKLPEGKLSDALCFVTGDPVEVASGRVLSSEIDFEIDGRIPIVFERIYDTSSIDYNGPFGWGWTHPYDQHLWESKKYKCLILRNNENRQVRFDLLNVGGKYFQPLERVWLERKSETEYELTDCKTGLIYDFGMLSGSTDDFTSEKNALRLLRIRDRNDNKVNLTYNDRLLKIIENGSGISIDLNYQNIDGNYRISEIRENLSNGQYISLMNYNYNGEGQLIADINRTYIPYTYHYENRLLAKRTNRNGLSFYFEYEGEGQNARCNHTWGDGGIYERWLIYSPNAKVTRVKDGLGGETVYQYNDLGLIIKVNDALGGTQQFEYGDKGELLKKVDELGRQQIFTYDEQLNCISITQEDGTSKRAEFNHLSLPVYTTDENGAQWRREYDKKGNVISIINPLKAERKYEYNSMGDVTKFIDAIGNITHFSWANNGRISEAISPRGGKTSYKYNERGLLAESFDETSGLSTQYSFDAQGRVVKRSEANQLRQNVGIQKYEYDAQGNLTIFTDALGYKTYFAYSGFDRLSERTDALGNKQRFKYDVEERLTQIINERDESYTFEYDITDRIVAEISFDGARTEYRYNPTGEVVYKKDVLDRETFYRRDLRGRVISRLRSDTSEIKYTYDECGRITHAQNEQSEVKLTYDANWQLIKEEQADKTVEYSYDANGNRTTRKLEGIDSHPVHYAYDADGNLSRIKIDDYEINFESDLIGRLSSKTILNGVREIYSYDKNGRPEGQRISVGAGGSDIVRRNYSWDALGNVVEISDSLRGVKSYSYDPIERIKKVERVASGGVFTTPDTGIKDRSTGTIPHDRRLWRADNTPRAASEQVNEVEYFNYDGAGNLLERNSNVKGATKSTYGRGNRLEKKDSAEYFYDAAGNLIQKRQANGEVIRYEYDIDNQLIAVDGGPGGRIEFRYDAFGRRTAKITKSGITGFLWDGDVLLGEQKDTLQEYVHHGFIPLAKIRNSKIENIHTDYSGTPTEVTSIEGKILWQGNYDEYGRVSIVNEETEQNIRFQGQYEDKETGLFYNRFRYYDADSCRYINQDPIGLYGGENFYAYTNNPNAWVDPYGLGKCPKQKLKERMQELTDQAFKDVTENPAIAKGLMSKESYAHLKDPTSQVYPMSFGKAVERRLAQLVANDAELSGKVKHTGLSRGPNGQFISSPDFTTGGRGKTKGMTFDVTTNKDTKAHTDRYSNKGQDTHILTYDIPDPKIKFPK